MSRLPVSSVLDYDYGSYKGYYAENVVMQEFRAAGRDNIACWREGRAEQVARAVARKFRWSIQPLSGS